MSSRPGQPSVPDGARVPLAAHLRSISGEQATDWWSVDVFSSVPGGGGGAASAGARAWAGLWAGPWAWAGLRAEPLSSLQGAYPGPRAARGARPGGRGLGSD